MICALHPILEEQIMLFSQQLHDVKMSIIRILIVGFSAVTTVVGAGIIL